LILGGSKSSRLGFSLRLEEKKRKTSERGTSRGEPFYYLVIFCEIASYNDILPFTTFPPD
jgi:hypothetical protein